MATTYDDRGNIRYKLSSEALNVRTVAGTGEFSRNRYRANVTTRVKVEWPAGSNITELVVFCCPNNAATADTGTYGVICIDAVSDASADAALTLTDSENGDAGWIPIPLSAASLGGASATRIPLTSALSQGSLSGGRVDMKSSDGIALDFWIGAN